jgi:hypothetical protein
MFCNKLSKFNKKWWLSSKTYHLVSKTRGGAIRKQRAHLKQRGGEVKKCLLKTKGLHWFKEDLVDLKNIPVPQMNISVQKLHWSILRHDLLCRIT